MSLSKRNLAKQFLSSGSGKAGTVLFITILIISILVVALYPLNFGVKVWNNPLHWADNPKAVPPAWTSTFSNNKEVEHQIFEAFAPDSVSGGVGTQEMIYTFDIDYDFDEFPTFLSLSVGRVDYYLDPPFVTLSIIRPDGQEVRVYRGIVSGPRTDEIPPFSRYVESPLRVNLGGDDSVASNVANFLRDDIGLDVSVMDVRGNTERALFGSFNDGTIDGAQVLKGQYQARVRFVTYDDRDSVESIKFIVGGSVFGFMGTDSLGRDLAVGLLFGFPVALAIGLVTATIITTIGTFLGIVSGYYGGKVDTAIQRTSDVLSNIPLLPILIFLIFILGQKLWIVMVILIAFGWPGLTIIVRSMVLQIRSGQSVEAAKALGASQWRIMFRHIFPQISPFIFAQLVFFTPAAILAEAALSFLGLGDPSIPTWGQMLEHGFRTGGVYIGFWWWILPPGILIVLTSMVFAFIALGLEPVVNPRLRRMD